MARLTFEQVETHVKKYTYKPGWFFQVQEPVHGTLYEHPETIAILLLNAYVPNSEDPEEMIGTTATCRVKGDEIEELDDLDGLISDFIMTRERHEMREWLKFDGVWVDYPHEDHIPEDLEEE